MSEVICVSLRVWGTGWDPRAVWGGGEWPIPTPNFTYTWFYATMYSCIAVVAVHTKPS